MKACDRFWPAFLQTNYSGITMLDSSQLALYLTGFGAALQIAGTAALGLFSFEGLKITPSNGVNSGGRPLTTVTVNSRWVTAGKVGLVLLLAGIAAAGFGSLLSLSA